MLNTVMSQMNLINSIRFDALPVEINFHDISDPESLAVYNPSRVYRDSSGEYKCLIRVEECPYTRDGRSQIHEAFVNVQDEKISLEIGGVFVEPCGSVKKTEDPWVSQLPNGDLIVSWINYDGEEFWQVLMHGEQVVELPKGMKGTRFFFIKNRVVIFARPTVGKLVTSGGSSIPADGRMIGYTILEVQEFSLSKLLELIRTGQFTLLELGGENSEKVWWGINELISYEDQTLLLYHSGRYIESVASPGHKQKKYDAHLARIYIEDDRVTICSTLPRSTFQRDQYPFETRPIRQIAELYNVVYPSGYLLHDGQLIIIGGVSDYNVFAVRVQI